MLVVIFLVTTFQKKNREIRKIHAKKLKVTISRTSPSPQRSPDYDDTSGWKLLSNAVGVKTSTSNLPS